MCIHKISICAIMLAIANPELTSAHENTQIVASNDHCLDFGSFTVEVPKDATTVYEGRKVTIKMNGDFDGNQPTISLFSENGFTADMAHNLVNGNRRLASKNHAERILESENTVCIGYTAASSTPALKNVSSCTLFQNGSKLVVTFKGSIGNDYDEIKRFISSIDRGISKPNCRKI